MSLRRDGDAVANLGLVPAGNVDRFRAPQGGTIPAEVTEVVRVGLSIGGDAR
jgi:hypothetical protein